MFLISNHNIHFPVEIIKYLSGCGSSGAMHLLFDILTFSDGETQKIFCFQELDHEKKCLSHVNSSRTRLCSFYPLA